MGKLKRNLKIYFEMYGAVTLDLLCVFSASIGDPINSTKLEKMLHNDKEIISLGYVQKAEVLNTELDALVKFGDNYLVSNWFLHPYYFDKRKKPYSKRALQVYHAKGLAQILKESK